MVVEIKHADGTTYVRHISGFNTFWDGYNNERGESYDSAEADFVDGEWSYVGHNTQVRAYEGQAAIHARVTEILKEQGCSQEEINRYIDGCWESNLDDNANHTRVREWEENAKDFGW